MSMGASRSSFSACRYSSAASFLLGTSESMNEVIVYRGVQGIGGGLIMTCSLVAVADLFPPEERGQVPGAFSPVCTASHRLSGRSWADS